MFDAVDIDEEDLDDFYETSEEDEIEDNDQIIRAKWVMDGANSLSEAAAQLRGYADWLIELESLGWCLRNTIEDDYGFIWNQNDPEASLG